MKSNLLATTAAGLILMLALPASHAELNMGGLVEVEVSAIDSDSAGDSSDITVPTVEVSLEAQLSDMVDVGVVFLAEDIGTDDQTSVEVDQAMINMALGGGVLTAGQVYVPFGAFESGAISDPLTLTLGETAETVLMYSLENESGIGFAAYVFNGSVDDTGGDDDEINDAGISISFNQEDWSIGADLISNIGDSDTMGDLAAPAEGDDVSGLAVHVAFAAGAFGIYAEHVAAMDEFDEGDAAGLEPSATHIEVSFGLDEDSALIASFSSADDADGIVDYEEQLLLAYSTTIMEQVGLTVEYISAEEFSGDEDSGVTLQLAAEF